MKNDIITLERAAKMLPPKCMVVFRLIREDGLKYHEAAQLLKMSPRAVEKQMDIADGRKVTRDGSSRREHDVHVTAFAPFGRYSAMWEIDEN